MRFNDKELSYFALNLVPDKEGTLEKKGAVRGQGELVEQRMKPVAAENVSCTAFVGRTQLPKTSRRNRYIIERRQTYLLEFCKPYALFSTKTRAKQVVYYKWM